MKKQIITIGRQFGSGGHTVGLELSEKLNIPFYDKELVEMVAEKSGYDIGFVGEQLEEAPARNTFVYTFIGRGLDGLSFSDKIWAAEIRVIQELVEKGPCVIVGRCADYLLRERQDVLKVFIYADRDYREKRIIEKYNETEVSVGRAIRDKDGKRATHYRYYTGQKWGRPENYHMLLNTVALGIDRCVEIIADVVQKGSDK